MNLCKNGHNLDEVGVYSRNQCKKCHSDRNKLKYENDPEFKARAIANAKKNRKNHAKTKEEWAELDKIRFMSYVDKDAETGCWNWTGAIMKTGYASFSAKRATGKYWRAHRYSWMIHGGEFIDGLELCHKCDNRKCVNPDHLWQGTRQENMLDMKAKGRNPNWNKTFCKNGHEFTPDNVMIRYDGFRECISCSKDTKKRWYLRNRDRILNAQRRRSNSVGDKPSGAE